MRALRKGWGGWAVGSGREALPAYGLPPIAHFQAPVIITGHAQGLHGGWALCWPPWSAPAHMRLHANPGEGTGRPPSTPKPQDAMHAWQPQVTPKDYMEEVLRAGGDAGKDQVRGAACNASLFCRSLRT